MPSKIRKKKVTKKSSSKRTESSVEDTAKTIINRLREALSPSRLSLKNESHLHQGHQGNVHKGGHYQVTVVSESFEGLSRLQRNRYVMKILQDLFPKEIHALSLSLKTESEVPLLEDETPKASFGRRR